MKKLLKLFTSSQKSIERHAREHRLANDFISRAMKQANINKLPSVNVVNAWDNRLNRYKK